MSIFLIVLLSIVAYLMAGAITLSICIRLRPYWFYVYFLNTTVPEDSNHWRGCSRTNSGCKQCEKIVAGLTGEEESQAYYVGGDTETMAFCGIFWWYWLVKAGYSMVATSTKRGINSGLSTRAELEKELGELKKEIDALRDIK